ncbi:MAG: hypothetical protein U5O15_10565 [Candidatus Krumholzibacteriota bacterium]|nr:hypothetical protein [Candidatus Krumholzibacteriota bacterium]
MSKFFSFSMIIVLTVSIFAGCGGELEETYTQVSLREANFAGIKSPGYKFSFDTPHFIASKDDAALVREGNLLDFFTGDKLGSEIEALKGKNYSVGVTKRFNPVVHYKVDFIVVGQDTSFVDAPAGNPLPNIVKGFDDSPYEEITLDGLTYNTRTTKEIIDTKFKIDKAPVTYEEVSYDGEPEMAFLLNLKNVSFIVDSPNEDTAFILRALMNENHYFKGGVSFGSRPTAATRNYRRINHIGGKVTVEYIEYAGKFISTI